MRSRSRAFNERIEKVLQLLNEDRCRDWSMHEIADQIGCSYDLVVNCMDRLIQTQEVEASDQKERTAKGNWTYRKYFRIAVPGASQPGLEPRQTWRSPLEWIPVTRTKPYSVFTWGQA